MQGPDLLDARQRQDRMAGIALRLGGALSFACMAAAIKLGFDAGVTLVELVFFRFVFGLPPLLAWMTLTGALDAWRTARPRAHASRAAIGLVSMALSFGALAYLPLAEATSISFAAPLFAVALSALVLKEEVGAHRWAAVTVGLAGVVVVAGPGGTPLPAIGILVALLGALGVAAVNIAIRRIGATERPQTTVLWFTVAGIVTAGLAMPAFASGHDAGTWLLLAALGLFGGLGQIFLTTSLRRAPVSVVVPFDYSQLLWAMLLGWLLWDRHVPSTTIAGAAIIAAGGLYALYRERARGIARAAVPPA